jgi:hypothetical protein
MNRKGVVPVGDVLRDWCASEPDKGRTRDWCGRDADASPLADWCGTDRQSPAPEAIASLARRGRRSRHR